MIKCDQVTSFEHFIWSVDILWVKLSIHKTFIRAPGRSRARLNGCELCLSKCELDSLSQLSNTPSLHLYLYWSSLFELKWQHLVKINIFCSVPQALKNFHRLPLHTGEPGHTEGIHTLLSFTTAAFVGRRLLLLLWLSPCFEVTFSVDWGGGEI